MSDDRMKIVESVYAAFGRGDAAALTALFRDTEWHEAEGMPYGGRYQGPAEIFGKVFGPIAGHVDGFSARPDEIIPAGEDRVLALGRYRGKGAKGDLDLAFAHLWTVRDGRIVKFVQYADTHKYRQATGL